MKELLILGAGTGGTIVANRMVRRLGEDWRVTVVDPSTVHLYQPGLLFLPFGARDEQEMQRERIRTLDDRVRWIVDEVEALDTAARTVRTRGGESLSYDLLVLATGAQLRPELTEGTLGPGWRERVFDFYTLEGAQALRAALDRFEGGRLLVHVAELPIKCPVAPLEFAFLADDFLRNKGVREKVELAFVTPLDAAFTRPVAAARLGHLLAEKDIRVVTEFGTASIDGAAGALRSYDDREERFDLLVTVPVHGAASFLTAAGLGDELGFVKTDKHTLAVQGVEGVYALGDVTNVPASKAGSVAHFEAEVLVHNLLRELHGGVGDEHFDGHANCFVETGNGRAMLIDFNYEVEPLPGKYPLPAVGPFDLLAESKVNHLGKLAFRWMYWNGLLPGNPIPVPTAMSMVGKELASPAQR